MPFVAKLISTNGRVDITQVENPKALIKKGDCVCQVCGSPLIIKGEHFRLGHKVQSHFAHIAECDGEYDAHPESAMHLKGKAYLRDMLKAWYGQYADVHIELEVPISMPWRAKGRIADIMVMWPMGWREVHEVQLAKITPEYLEERTSDYLRSGVDVTWWLGGNADTAANRAWSCERFGESLGIDIRGQSEPYHTSK